jgi:DNA-binding transcriptional LysR family regulator
VAVAEELSFARAADRLHLSQPALSESVARLETELGTRLLARTSRSVRLTPAGAVLLEDAREVLGRADAALDRARAAGRGEAGTLRLGFTSTGAGELGTRAQARFLARHPGARVQPRVSAWGGEADALREGRCDVAFLWLPAASTGLELEEVASERRFAGLPAGHRLARREELSILELNPEPIMWTRRAPRRWVDWWAVNPRPDGSEPRWGPDNENAEEMLEQVAAGIGVCIGPASMAARHARPDLAWIPLADVEPLRIALAWPAAGAAGPPPLVRGFRDVVRELVREGRRATPPPR